MQTDETKSFQEHFKVHLASSDEQKGSSEKFKAAFSAKLKSNPVSQYAPGQLEEGQRAEEFMSAVQKKFGVDEGTAYEAYQAYQKNEKMGFWESGWHYLKSEYGPTLLKEMAVALRPGLKLSKHQAVMDLNLKNKGEVVYAALKTEAPYFIDEKPTKEEIQANLDAGYPKNVAYAMKPQTALRLYAKGIHLNLVAKGYKLSPQYKKDLEKVDTFFRHVGRLEAQASKGQTTWGMLGTGVFQSAAFMLELVGTKGITKLLTTPAKAGVKVAKEAAEQSAKKTLIGIAKRTVKRAPGSVGRTALQAPVMPTTTITALKSMTPHIKVEGDEYTVIEGGEGAFNAFTSSLLDTMISVQAEKAGATVGQVGGVLLQRLPTGRKIMAALQKGFKQKNPGSGIAEFSRAFFKRAEFHGVFGEAVEERLEDFMRYGLGRQENLLPSLEEWALELGVLGILKGGQVSLTGGATALEAIAQPKEKTEALPVEIEIPEVEIERPDYSKAGEGVEAAAKELAAAYGAEFTYTPDQPAILADMVGDPDLPAFTEEAAAGLLKSHDLPTDTDLSTVQLVGYAQQGDPVLGTQDEITIAQGGNIYDVVEEVFESNYKNLRPEQQTDLQQELKAYELVNGQLSEGNSLERLSDLARAAAFDQGLHKKLGFKLKEIVDRLREVIHRTIRHARMLRSQVKAGNVSSTFLKKIKDVTYQRAIDKQLGALSDAVTPSMLTKQMGAIKGPVTPSQIRAEVGTAFEGEAVQQPGKRIPAAIQQQAARSGEKPGYKGEAFRSPTGFIIEGTAADVVRYEQEELRNKLGVSPAQLKELEQYPASDIIWVARTKEQAERYGIPEKIDVEGGKIIADIGPEGVLVLKPKSGTFAVMGEQRTQSEVEKLRQDVEFWKGKAQTDRLTGLRSKDYATERLPEVLKQSSKAGKPISVVFMDLTNFKALNEMHGHEKADKALAAVGEAVSEVTRKERGDELAFSSRYGGDELLLTLPGASAFDADRVTQRIKQRVNQRLKEMGMHQVVQDKQVWPISLNEGIVTQQPGELLDASELVERADLESQKRRAELNRLYGLDPSARFAKKEQAGDDISAALVRILPPLPQNLTPTKIKSHKGLVHQTIKGVGEVGSLTSDLITPISTALYKISPTFFRRLRLFEQVYRLRIKADIDKITPFIKKMVKLPADVRKKLDLYFKHGDIAAFQPILEKYGMAKDYLKVQAVLNKIYDDAKAVGIDLGYTEIFMPRSIKDLNELRNILAAKHNEKYWSEFETAIQQRERETGKQMGPEERTDYINQLIRGYGSNRIQITAQGHSKGRVLKTLTPELNEQYHSSEVALPQYIQQMRESIEARKMLGMDKADTQIEDSIGSYVHGMIEQQAITPEQERELVEILTARFSSKSPRGILRTYRDFQYIDLLTSAAVAIRQLEDLGIAWYRGGILTGLPKVLTNFTKAALSKSDIKLIDLGIYDVAAEMTDPSKVKKVLDIGLLAAGFKYLDRIGKEATINTIIQTYQKKAKKAKKRGKVSKDFHRRIEKVFGERADEVIDKMASGTIDPDVQYLAFSELLDVQPTALSEMSKKYLQMSDGKVLFVLKSFMLRRLDFVLNETIRQIRVNPVQGIINTFRLTAALSIMGVATDELQDWILGRRTSLSEQVVDNLLRLFGFSRYNVHDAQMSGGWKALASRIVPPFRLVDSLGRDIRDLARGKYTGSESVASIPLIGKIIYWRWGKGAKKEKKKHRRERPQTLGKILRKRIGPKKETPKRTRLRIG